MKSIIIAAPRSGSGKTTITLGIMASLVRRGLRVAPCKAGPDFIDPGYHRCVTGLPSLNLDGWICPESFLREAFARQGEGADLVVVEGVMGLFDGIGAGDAGSTAQLARILGVPVVLVVDAQGQARSVAPLVQGFARFDPAVRVAGVIFNNVGSERHAALLREAVEGACPGIGVLGAIPRDGALRIPSRHLGLVTAEEEPLSAAFVDRLVEVAERHLDLDGLLALGATPHSHPLPPGERVAEKPTPVRIAVARDEAFCFVYEENLRLLREAGGEIVAFSPLRDDRLPPGVAGLYLPGGYPELFAPRLSANGALRGAIREAIEGGMPVYGECGGLIYLTAGMANPPPPTPLLNQEGVPDRAGVVELVGVLPVTTRMLPRRKALGYREVEFAADTILGPQGTVARGHEFHYSETEEMPPEVERLYRVRRGEVELAPEGYRHKNCLASYVHLHFGSNPALAANFVASCRAFKGAAGI